MNPNCIPSFPKVCEFIDISALFPFELSLIPPVPELAKLVELIVHPPISPPLNNTFEPVICPPDFKVNALLEEFICVADKSNPPIVPPLNNTFEPVICPICFILNELLEDFISSVFTVNPAIEADTNFAKPCESILDDALFTVDGEPPINAGVNIELAATEPSIVTLSVIVPPVNKKLLPVTSPFCLTLNLDVLINIYLS